MSLQPFTPVPATRAPGTVNPSGDMDQTALQLLALNGSFNVLNRNFAGGADASGVNDSTGAFQAAMTAATGGQPVIVPPGTYLVNSETLVPLAGTPGGLIGFGDGTTIINFDLSTAGIDFDTNTGYERYLIRDITLNQNGAGDVAACGTSSGQRFPQLFCRNADFITTNDGGACLNGNDPANSDCLASSLFHRCTFSSTSATRTIPMISLICAVAGGLSNVTWDKCDFNPADNEQYCVYLSASTGGSDNGYHAAMVLRDCRFESPNGGAIQSMSGRGLKIINPTIWDIGLSSGPSLAASLIYIGSNSGQYVSAGTEIRGYTRYNGSASSGLTPNGTSEWDIYIDANSAQTHIDSPATVSYYRTHSDPVQINCNGCPSVTITNPQSSGAADPATIAITNPPAQLTYPALQPAVSQWMPSDMGYAAESFDLALGDNSNTRLITAGKLNFIGLQLRQYYTATGVDLFQIANGAGLTSGECLIGLYSSAGVLLGYSADQSTAWGSGEPDKVSAALTAESAGSLILTPGLYWVALLGNGTTMPSFLSQGTNQASSQVNGRLGAAVPRAAISNAIATTVASGSNGGEISDIASWSSPSAGVLDVASGSSFPAGGGTAYVAASGSTTGQITFTGQTGTTLTGCAYVAGSPAGTVATGGAVTNALTALPASFTPGSGFFTASQILWWAGLY